MRRTNMVVPKENIIINIRYSNYSDATDSKLYFSPMTEVQNHVAEWVNG